MCNENIKRIAQKELERVGVNPAYLEAMVDLVKQSDDMQRLSDVYYSLQMQNEVLERRFKANLRENKIKERLINEMFNCLVDIVHIDPTESGCVEKLKDVQNKASWCISEYGLKKVNTSTIECI